MGASKGVNVGQSPTEQRDRPVPEVNNVYQPDQTLTDLGPGQDPMKRRMAGERSLG